MYKIITLGLEVNETVGTCDTMGGAIIKAMNLLSGQAKLYKKKYSFDCVEYDGMVVLRLIDARYNFLCRYAVVK